jgi:5'(3')-deoxyribonucleotidase
VHQRGAAVTVRVLLDVDGVLADSSEAFLYGLYYTSGIQATHADLTDWDFKVALGITPEQERLAWDYVAQDLDAIPEFPRAVEAVNRIARVHQVVFVTAPQLDIPGWVPTREAWLGERFGAMPVIHTHHKHLIPGDWFIDDRLSNVRHWAAANPRGRAILWAAPYNEKPASAPWITRTADWDWVEALLGVTP